MHLLFYGCAKIVYTPYAEVCSTANYGGFVEALSIDRSMSIVVFSGAGMSRESGIPVYRGDGGLFFP